MYKTILATLAAGATLAAATPAFAGRDYDDDEHRGYRHYGHHRHHHFKQRYHHYYPRPVVVMPAPRVYYAPPPVYYPAPVPHSGISIRLHFPL